MSSISSNFKLLMNKIIDFFPFSRELYHQVETQFLAAKLSLHQVSEKKEMLTEHLCTIISHNEDRKAKKLSELLNKVGLNSDCPPSDADQNVGNTTNTN